MSLSSSEQTQLLIAGYVLGDLNASEAAELEQLMVDNPAIAAEVAQMQQALELPYNPTEVAPSPALRSAILAAATQPNPSSVSTTIQSTASPRRASVVPWSRVLGMAAAALIVALGISNYRLWQTLRETQAQQSTDTLVYFLQGTENATQASATVVVDPKELEAILSVENLPPLPPGKVYVLWTVVGKETPYPTDEKGAILTQVFQVSNQGEAMRKIALPEVYRSSELIAKVAVTLEDGVAPERHVGPIVMMTGS
jgi:anti-sigma-K factor RskA